MNPNALCENRDGADTASIHLPATACETLQPQFIVYLLIWGCRHIPSHLHFTFVFSYKIQLSDVKCKKTDKLKRDRCISAFALIRNNMEIHDSCERATVRLAPLQSSTYSATNRGSDEDSDCCVASALVLPQSNTVGW